MTICIAAPGFGEVSETFINSHVRSIAQGATVLLCRDGRYAEQYGCPVLADVDQWQSPQSSTERIFNFNAVRFRWRRYVNPSLFTSNRRRVRSFLKAHQTKAVLAEYGPMGCLLARTCNEADVPLYVHFHGYDASILLRDWWQVRHYRAMFHSAAGVIVPCRFLANKLTAIGCPENKVHVSAYGIDPVQFRPTDRLPGRVVAVGRLVEKKAPDLTIKAFAQIRKVFPSARLEMVGDGPLADKCWALIRDLSLTDCIHMHGDRHHDFTAQMMQNASLFVQHSVTATNGDSEGLPVAILEAMASALPVVSTRHSGIPEAVENGVTGLLVAEHDVDHMAAAMAELLNDPNRAASMGKAGRSRVLADFTREKERDRLRAIMDLAPLPTAGAYAA
jgi:colanic acid/amylovoran biosynthesis glycosyltransferase